MPIHTRRYFQIVEKDPADVNPVWKVIHSIVFILIVVLSFGAAFTFHDIFDSFNFQCILYGKPALHLEDIIYHNTSVSNTTTGYNTTQTNLSDPNTTPTNFVESFDSTTEDLDLVTEMTTLEPKKDVKDVVKIEIKGDHYWVTNSTMTGRVAVNFRHTVFGSKGICNAVLFFPLASLVLSTFCAVLVMICGRGGRGYQSDLYLQPWIYVYPLLALSLITLIFNAVIASWLHKGMKIFCAEFKYYTGEEECSFKINYFTIEYIFGTFNLYQTYMLCLDCIYGELILWALQVVLIILRVVCIADFQLNVVTVACSRRHSLQYQEDPVNDVMMNTFAGLRQVVLVGENYYEDDVDVTESSTQVHQALTKSHSLKTVTFVEKKGPKEDKDDDVTPL